MLRYGSARDLCLGVEAVMADGSILHRLGRVAKDNMGYDLRHLLIGAEGTLGLITAASLRLLPLPEETATAWIAVASPAAALALLQRDAGGARRHGLGLRTDRRPGARLPGGDPAAGAAAAGPAADWLVLAEAADGRGGAVAGAWRRRWRRRWSAAAQRTR